MRSSTRKSENSASGTNTHRDFFHFVRTHVSRGTRAESNINYYPYRYGRRHLDPDSSDRDTFPATDINSAALLALVATAELDRFEVGPCGDRYAALVHSWRLQ